MKSISASELYSPAFSGSSAIPRSATCIASLGVPKKRQVTRRGAQNAQSRGRERERDFRLAQSIAEIEATLCIEGQHCVRRTQAWRDSIAFRAAASPSASWLSTFAGSLKSMAKVVSARCLGDISIGVVGIETDCCIGQRNPLVKTIRRGQFAA